MSAVPEQRCLAVPTVWVLAGTQGRPGGAERESSIEVSPRARGKWVLVVDDDESIREMVASVLRSAGYSVRQAGDGESALSLVGAEEPALVVLDMRMPRVDGWEFARRLRALGKRSPIIVMTAMRDARTSAEQIGAVGYVAKPFDIDRLLAQVSEHIGGPVN